MQKIDSRTKTVKELLANNEYNLDYYQREYVWTREQVDALIADLINQFKDDYKETHPRQEVATYSHYFLGSIVVRQDNTKRFIVDGQQRLTTLTLLLIFLHHELEDEEKSQIATLIFSHRYGDKSFNLDIPERKSVMEALYSQKSLEPFKKPGQQESIRNIAVCYERIARRFKVELLSQSYPYFSDWLLENVCLVEITAPTNEDAYTVFETMNDRGLPLTSTEMLRGYLLSKITDHESREDVVRIWDKQIQKLKQIGKDVEAEAIKAWLRSQYANNVPDSDRIGSEFHRWFRDKEGSKLKLINSHDFGNLIKRDFAFYTNWYHRLYQVGKDIKPGLEWVYYNAQNITFHYPFLLAPLDIEDSEEESIRKIQIVATYIDIVIYRRIWNLLLTTQNSIADQMFPIIPEIRDKSSNELSNILYSQLDVQNQRKMSNLSIPPFTNNSLFSLQGNNREKIRLLLARITDYIEVQSRQPFRYSEYEVILSKP